MDDELQAPEAVEAQLSGCNVVFGDDEDDTEKDAAPASDDAPKPSVAPDKD